MRALPSSMLALVLAALPLAASADNTLKSVDGTVTYGAQQNPTTKLAKNASTQLGNNDWAKTGASSKATVTLPDSSIVLMGENSDVQMQSFDNASGTATAKFFVVGKVRFSVEHPAGAKANYTFTTPTGQIAVRGTVGDILSTLGQGGGPGGLQVNVYSLGSIANPVQVTLLNGQVFTLAAGQSLVVTAAGGALIGTVGAVSQTSFAPFTQLGAPANASSLGISTTATTTAAGTTAAGTTAATTAAATTATVTTTAVAVGTAAAVAATSNTTPPTTAPSASPTIAPTVSPSASPTLSPSPAPTGTTVPITISGKPITGGPPSGGTTAPGGRAPLPMPRVNGRPTPPAQ